MKYKKFSETRREVIILDEWVKTRWTSGNKAHYVQLGYKYTRMHDELICKVTDLLNGSDVKVCVQCPVCKKERKITYNNVLKAGHTLCGGCRQIRDLTGMKFNRLTAIEIDKSSRKKRLKWICECECGTMKSIQASHLTSGATNSCGCYHRDVTSALSGENSPYWNHNLSKKERLERRAYQSYFRWREAVFERDGYACKVCGHNKGGDLRAHHIYSYKKHRDQQLDINNGITLCVLCHDEFHRNFMGDTRIPCTLDDFIKWLITKEKKPIEVMSFLKDL